MRKTEGPTPSAEAGRQRLLVLGTTDFSANVADASTAAGHRVAGFVENLSRARCRKPLAGLPVHWIDDVDDLTATHMVVCGLGTTRRSAFVEQALARGLRFATVIHPTASISRTSTVGVGTYVGPRAVIASYATIGRHVLVLAGSIVGDRSEIGDYASVLMGVCLARSCRIGTRVYVGAGVVVAAGVSVGSHSIVGAGAVVESDVPDRVQVVGAPARIVKEEIESR